MTIYFNIGEFFPNCSSAEMNQVLYNRKKCNNLWRLLCILNNLRSKLGHPIFITSGYRDAYHNAKVSNSSPTSQHIQMEAVDIKSDYNEKLLDIITEECGASLGQVIVYPTFIHIALPSTKYKTLTISFRK